MGLFKPAITIILTLVFIQNATAQLGFTALGSRAQAMGNASVALEDNFSPFNNIGATSTIEHFTAIASFENRFAFVPFQHFGAGVIYPAKFGVLSFTAQKVGADLYNEQNYGVGFSNKFGMVSLGIQINYTQFFIQDTGSKGVPSIAFGGVAEILPSLSFGAHVYNITQSKLSKENELYLPVILKSGISYKAIEILTFCLEAEKDLDKEVRIKGGLEYQFLKKFSLRSGISSAPFQHHFGLGFTPFNFSLDYALTTHSELGIIHQMSIAYVLKNNEN